MQLSFIVFCSKLPKRLRKRIMSECCFIRVFICLPCGMLIRRRVEVDGSVISRLQVLHLSGRSALYTRLFLRRLAFYLVRFGSGSLALLSVH